MSAYTLRPADPDFPLIRIGRGSPSTVGRQQDNTTVLRHPSISRHHARLEAQPQGLLLTDLGSLNGTFVNGVRTSEVTLLDGDLVQFGTVRFTVEYEEPLRTSSQRIYRQFAPETGSFTAAGSHLSLTSLRVSSERDSPVAADRLATLLTIANALTAIESEAALLDRILEELQGIIAFDRAAILLFDTEGVLRPAVTRPLSAGPEVAGYISMTIIQEAMASGQAILTSDAAEDPRFHGARSVVDYQVRSAICLPLPSLAGPVGALYLDNRVVPSAYSEGDLAYLGAFACQAGLALSNMHLQQRLRQEAAVQANFSRFFAPKTVQAIVRSSQPLALGGDEREVTVLFSDIRGYTELSERLSPPQVAELLNDYFPQMVEIVFQQEGTLEKYIGDALVAVWGAPLPQPDAPARAVQAALRMLEVVSDLNAWWAENNKPYRIDIGIGINTGPALVGNIGSERYLQFATIGDATNTASRLCDLADAGEIVVSESTARDVPETTCVFGAFENVALRGKRAPVRACRLRAPGAARLRA